MKRLILVYNPRSSRFASVKSEVLDPAKKLKGYMIGKYEVAPTNLDDNIKKLAQIIKDDDLIISAGGDATGIIASNAILHSRRDAILSVLPYGNFNDLARTLGVPNFNQVINSSKIGKLYPLEIHVNNQFFRWATCYVTLGMTAEAVQLYDRPNMRKKLKTEYGRNVTSYTALIGWYFKNRHKKQFIPDFKFNGQPMPSDSSDYAAVNGRYMARVMQGRNDFEDPKIFRSIVGRLTHFWRLFDLMAKSILVRVPGNPTTQDILEFDSPSTVEIQTEGESRKFYHTTKIEIKKGGKCLRIIQN